MRRVTLHLYLICLLVVTSSTKDRLIVSVSLEQLHKILRGTFIKSSNRKKKWKEILLLFLLFFFPITSTFSWPLVIPDREDLMLNPGVFSPLQPPYQSIITKVIYFFFLQWQLSTQCAALRCRRPAACTQSSTCWGIPGELLVFYPAKSISWGVKDATSTQTKQVPTEN